MTLNNITFFFHEYGELTIALVALIFSTIINIVEIRKNIKSNRINSHNSLIGIVNRRIEITNNAWEKESKLGHHSRDSKIGVVSEIIMTMETLELAIKLNEMPDDKLLKKLYFLYWKQLSTSLRIMIKDWYSKCDNNRSVLGADLIFNNENEKILFNQVIVIGDNFKFAWANERTDKIR